MIMNVWVSLELEASFALVVASSEAVLPLFVVVMVEESAISEASYPKELELELDVLSELKGVAVEEIGVDGDGEWPFFGLGEGLGVSVFGAAVVVLLVGTVISSLVGNPGLEDDVDPALTEPEGWTAVWLVWINANVTILTDASLPAESEDSEDAEDEVLVLDLIDFFVEDLLLDPSELADSTIQAEDVEERSLASPATDKSEVEATANDTSKSPASDENDDDDEKDVTKRSSIRDDEADASLAMPASSIALLSPSEDAEVSDSSNAARILEETPASSPSNEDSSVSESTDTAEVSSFVAAETVPTSVSCAEDPSPLMDANESAGSARTL